MPTILSHAAVPLALGMGLGMRAVPSALLAAGVLASIAPDLDVLAFRLHVPYAHAFGHRGASHSVLFALLLGVLAAAAAPALRSTRAVAFGFVGLSALSHALLDMLTRGGLGVALWWPWSDARLLAPWPLVDAAPLNWRRAFGARGWEVFQSELAWIWLPCAAACLALWALRRLAARRRAAMPMT